MIQIITKKLNFEKTIEPKAMNLQFYFIMDKKKKKKCKICNIHHFRHFQVIVCLEMEKLALGHYSCNKCSIPKLLMEAPFSLDSLILLHNGSLQQSPNTLRPLVTHDQNFFKKLYTGI